LNVHVAAEDRAAINDEPRDHEQRRDHYEGPDRDRPTLAAPVVASDLWHARGHGMVRCCSIGDRACPVTVCCPGKPTMTTSLRLTVHETRALMLPPGCAWSTSTRVAVEVQETPRSPRLSVAAVRAAWVGLAKLRTAARAASPA